jgi:ribosomal protein S18 acetylase RimI-like enzyme
MKPPVIRTYSSEDKSRLLVILKLNIPQFFDESEESDFIQYLDHRKEDYFVVESDGLIIGSGGINYFPEDNSARISWDIIHPDFQGKGIGSNLIRHRIDHIQKDPTISTVKVRTSQLAYKFYQKAGFELEFIEKDFWTKGFDLYQMTLELNKTKDTKN